MFSPKWDNIAVKEKKTMNKEGLKNLAAAVLLFAAFLIFTVLVQRIDVQPIGPNGSCVGFAALNGWFHALTHVHMTLYTITDWLGLAPLFIALCFAVLGLVQLIKRRSFWKVDHSILILGAFYLAVIGTYLYFETHIINFRPVLIEGYLEASYPSSTTLMSLCILPTAMMQFYGRMRPGRTRTLALSALGIFTAFMVMGRLVSGVHWLTDIVGGILLSAALVLFYRAAVLLSNKK